MFPRRRDLPTDRPDSFSARTTRKDSHSVLGTFQDIMNLSATAGRLRMNVQNEMILREGKIGKGKRDGQGIAKSRFCGPCLVKEDGGRFHPLDAISNFRPHFVCRSSNSF